MASKHAVRRAASYCKRARAHLIPLAANPRDTFLSSAAPPEDSEIWEPITHKEDIGQVVYIVEPNAQVAHYELVQADDLATAEMTEAELHASGLDRLTEFANARIELLKRPNDLWELQVGEASEASLLLLGTLWDRVIPEYVGTAFYAAVPRQDCLLIGGPNALDALIAAANAQVDDSEPIYHANILSWEQSKWIRSSHQLG